MDAIEKLQRAIQLKPTPEIPVYPMVITWAGRCAGATQADIFSSNKAWLRAMEATYEKIGRPDAVFPMCPADVAFTESMKVRLPGKELGPDEQFQFVEEEVMQVSDFDVIINEGWAAWNTAFMKQIQAPPWRGRLGGARVTYSFVRTGMRIGSNRRFWAKQGLPLMFHAGIAPAFDVFSLSRSLRCFYHDLFTIPDTVKQAVEIGTTAVIAIAKRAAKVAGGRRIAVFAMRSSGSFISPKMFEEFILPSLQRMVEEFHAAGLVTVLHCDADWGLMLPYLKEFPRGSCVVELDGATDIRKAREVLDGWHCIRGDCRAALLSLGTPDEVEAYCRALIDFMGHDGGFILGSGCEVPLNAPPENIAAMISAARR